MSLVDDSDETLYCDVDRRGGCGSDLTEAPVARVERRQVTDIAPSPPPYVTEYRIITRTCPCCTASWAGTAPEGVTARAQYGPRVLATAAELTCAHYLPVGRATALLATLAGVEVSVGFMAGVRGRAARLLGCSTLNWPHCSFAHRNSVAHAVTASAVTNLARCSKSASRSSATAARRRPGPTTWNLLPDGPPLEHGESATGGWLSTARALPPLTFHGYLTGQTSSELGVNRA